MRARLKAMRVSRPPATNGRRDRQIHAITGLEQSFGEIALARAFTCPPDEEDLRRLRVRLSPHQIRRGPPRPLPRGRREFRRAGCDESHRYRTPDTGRRSRNSTTSSISPRRISMTSAASPSARPAAPLHPARGSTRGRRRDSRSRSRAVRARHLVHLRNRASRNFALKEPDGTNIAHGDC